jgi:hypothetical protein
MQNNKIMLRGHFILRYICSEIFVFTAINGSNLKNLSISCRFMSDYVYIYNNTHYSEDEHNQPSIVT